MKKSYIMIGVVLIVVLVVIVMSRGKKLEAPTRDIDSTVSAGDTGQNPGPSMKAPAIPSDWNASVTTTTAPTKTFTVTGQNFSFVPSTMSVKKGDLVKITFKNGNGMHDFRIDEFKVGTNIIKSGEEQTISFIADKTGSFEYYCSVGSHRAMGMKGILTVE